MSDGEGRTQRYEELSERLLQEHAEVARGTMMGFPCLRWDGRFFASLERGTGRLILKLPAARVAELVATGTGEAFAPNGRVFREWIALAGAADWDAHAGEALRFASEAPEPA